MPNEITKVEITLHPDDHYRITMTKRFAPEYGGGESTINIGGAYYNLHFAIEAAKRAITVTPGRREDFEAEDGRPA